MRQRCIYYTPPPPPPVKKKGVGTEKGEKVKEEKRRTGGIRRDGDIHIPLIFCVGQKIIILGGGG